MWSYITIFSSLLQLSASFDPMYPSTKDRSKAFDTSMLFGRYLFFYPFFGLSARLPPIYKSKPRPAFPRLVALPVKPPDELWAPCAACRFQTLPLPSLTGPSLVYRKCLIVRFLLHQQPLLEREPFGLDSLSSADFFHPLGAFPPLRLLFPHRISSCQARLCDRCL